MDTNPPPVEELRRVDAELARLDARRAELLARRAWLLGVLYAPPARPAAPPFPGAVTPAETSPRGAQNVLLTLGGTLLAIAALAFTLVSWGSMGIAGRSAVLLAVTSAALAAPAVLLRRGLASTAEAVGALGLVLTVLDAYALHRVALPGTDGLGYAAVASAVLAGLWAGYGGLLRRLRLPFPAAVAAAQLPLPLGVLAAGGGPAAVAWAAVLTAAADVLLLGRPVRAEARIAAGASAGVLAAWALPVGTWLSLTSPWTGAPLLLGCAALCLYAARAVRPAASALAVVAGLAAVAAVGGPPRAALPPEWTVPVYAVCGLALASLWRPVRAGWIPGAVRAGFGLAGGGVAAVGVLWALPPVLAGVLGPADRSAGLWSGRHAAPVLADHPATAVLVLLLGAVAAATAGGVWGRWGAVALGWALLTALPVALELSYAAGLAVRLVATAAALGLAVRPGAAARGLPEPEPEPEPEPAPGSVPERPEGAWGASWTAGAAVPAAPPAPGALLGWTGLAAALASAGSALLLALDVRAATFVVLGVLLALFTAAAVLGAGAVRETAAGAAVLAAAGLAGAGAAAAGLSAAAAGLVLLLVPAGTAALAVRVRSVAAEPTGVAVGALGVALTVPRPAVLALALALGGVVAAATALRPERRRAASWAAGALFLAAAWVRLAVWGVSVPEAYTLPVTVPALVVGLLRRRRDPEASSWAAYGPGLAVTLVPGLAAVWSDPDWVRPLLLGAGALAVTLLGARFRLQAPLVLGGTALVLVGAHELAPYVVQLVGALPRWLPPAAAGLLLLAVGATYERRLCEARMLRERLARMR
ncbi:SCO7613 C-terminal domain-containing membrane protein [Streptomyces sp. NPDC058757]|uniref:SCO7613 C-terminal domain-containing membrane protein n=1 Tax=Streptomyces sp. NPDC058757 TaxID=3346626 RepID=UPI0036ACE35D